MNLRNWLKAFWTNEVGAVCIGCGLKTVDGILVAEISPAAGNTLTCETDGLYVPTPAATVVSEDDCQGIEARGDGLWAAEVNSLVGTTAVQISPQGTSGAGTLPYGLSTAGDAGYLNNNSATSIHICNTLCVPVTGLVFCQVGDVFIDADPGYFGSAHLQVSINSGVFNDVQPSAERVVHNNTATVTRYDLDNIATNLLSGPHAAGACVDYQWNLLIHTTAGTGTLASVSTGPKFVTRWMFTPTP